MDLPEHLWRFPTNEAIDSLAVRFDLPNLPGMQDWEYQVSDPYRIDEFLNAYESGELTEDECFVLMQIILDSFEHSTASLAENSQWLKVLQILEEQIDLHIHSVWYWSSTDAEKLEYAWKIAPYLRKILHLHLDKFQK